jgi:hypothetical protein
MRAASVSQDRRRGSENRKGKAMTDQTGHSAAPDKQKTPEGKGAMTDTDELPENSKESLDRKLDEGIEETFPASDPVSVKITK